MNTTTRTTESLILQKVHEVGLKELADVLNKDTSTISRVVSNKGSIHINDLDAFLETLGLKVIECKSEAITIPRERYEALRLLAKDGI